MKKITAISIAILLLLIVLDVTTAPLLINPHEEKQIEILDTISIVIHAAHDFNNTDVVLIKSIQSFIDYYFWKYKDAQLGHFVLEGVLDDNMFYTVNIYHTIHIWTWNKMWAAFFLLSNILIILCVVGSRSEK